MSARRALIIGDPLEQLHVNFDSSLAMAQGLLALGYAVFWCCPADIGIWNQDVVVAKTRQLLSVDAFSYKAVAPSASQNLLSQFQLCLVRKDPPFDEHYKDLCWLLATQRQVQFINPPEALLIYHEKSLPWHAYQQGVLGQDNLIPTCLSFDKNLVRNFCSQFGEGQEFISKPWLGHGGQDVVLHSNAQDVLAQMRVSERRLVQPFLNEITVVGDRRVFLVNGHVLFHYVRFPRQGGIVSNTAQGGHAVLQPLSAPQQDLCTRLAHFLKEKGILLAGIDLIGLRVSEINITSPTGIRLYEQLAGTSMSERLCNILLSS